MKNEKRVYNHDDIILSSTCSWIELAGLIKILCTMFMSCAAASASSAASAGGSEKRAACIVESGSAKRMMSMCLLLIQLKCAAAVI